jgi:hypothetical protein
MALGGMVAADRVKGTVPTCSPDSNYPRRDGGSCVRVADTMGPTPCSDGPSLTSRTEPTTSSYVAIADRIKGTMPACSPDSNCTSHANNGSWIRVAGS